MAILIEIKNVSNPAVTLDFSQSELNIERKTLIAGDTKQVYSNLEDVQRDAFVRLYLENKQLELYINGNLISNYDALLWINNLAIKEIRPTKSIDHTAFVSQGGGAYHLDWNLEDYTDFDLVVDITAGDVNGIYRVILPSTDLLSLGQVVQRQVFLKDKEDTQQLVCRPFNSADDARVLGGIVGGGSKPTAHCLAKGDTIKIILNRELSNTRQIIFAKRALHKTILTRNNSLSSNGFTNPAGNNMLFNSFISDGEQVITPTGNPGYSAWNIRGFERKFLIDWQIEYEANGFDSYTIEAWLTTANGGEVPQSRLKSSSDYIPGMGFTVKNDCVFIWKQTDGNMNFKVIRSGEGGNFTKILIQFWEVL